MNLVVRPMIIATAAAMLLGSMLGIGFPLSGQKNTNQLGFNSANSIGNFQSGSTQDRIVSQKASGVSDATITAQNTPSKTTTTTTTTTTGQTKKPVQALW